MILKPILYVTIKKAFSPFFSIYDTQGGEWIIKKDLLSVPFIDGLNIAKDHAVLAFSEVFRHGYFMILFILGLAHILDVLATMCEVTDL